MNTYITIYVESVWHSLNLNDFTEYIINDSVFFNSNNNLITFQSGSLIPYIKAKNQYSRLPTIIDLECFDKQMSQEGKEFRNFRQWKVIHFLRRYKLIDSEFDLKYSNLKLLLEKLATLYLDLLEKDLSEKNRFQTIELSINKIIYQRQYKGVRIDMNFAEQKCVELEQEIYSIKNILQLEHNIFNPENEKQQIEYIKSKKYSIVQSPKYTLKIWRNSDRVCELLYSLIRSIQDLDSFVYILSHWGGKERTFPTYYGFGSITSRITMRQPSLQNLRKINRSVVIPENGMKFLYIDYSQFEAGILASLSEDEDLIQLYNSDIYGNLAEEVLKDKSKRDDAKIIFYRFMYGDDSLDESAKNYFSKFKNLNKFKDEISRTLQKDGRIGTVNGNFRCPMTAEASWTLSHMIQATASLIYKNAVIRANKEVYSAKFVIPMHDGTLYEIQDFDYERSKKAIETIYIEEFSRLCPLIKPKLTSKESFN